MKMKQACQATALTERAIRLYLAKGLLSPAQKDGVIHFSQEDIRRLKDIAVLRRFDFTLEQIALIIHQPERMNTILRDRSAEAAQEKLHQTAVSEVLESMAGKSFADLNELATALASKQAGNAALDIRQAEVERQDAAVHGAIARLEGKKVVRRCLLMLGGAALALMVIVFVFLSQVRLKGFVPVGPFTVVSQQADGTMTIALHSDESIALLGYDVITVRCHVFGAPVQAGETLEAGGQLALEWTNYDLARLGIHPLQNMKTRNQAVNDAYKTWALQALFEKEAGKGAVLYIREISNLPPLF